MPGYIPLQKTLGDFQKMLKSSALSGVTDITPTDIITQLRKEPIYDTHYVVKEVTDALVAKNPETNCLTGNSTEYVIVNREKLNEVLSIIQDGGMKLDEESE